MKNETFGFGDVLVSVAILMMLLKWAGVLVCSWMAINRFTIFVLIYLVIYFILDTTIKVIDSVIAKKRDE